MQAKPHLHAVDSPDLFQYPISHQTRLDSHFFIPWNLKRWRKSEFRQLVAPEVGWYGLHLIFEAHDETPIGTLPLDERLLASALGITVDRWRELCDRTISPLYNWQECMCDNGHKRLYHPVVLEMVKEAIKSSAQAIDKKAADRERKRIDALPDQMMRAGAHKGMTEDRALVLRFDQFLLDHFDGQQRRPTLLRTAIDAFSLSEDGRDWRAEMGL